MRILALHEDVIVFLSSVWQTTCTAVRAGDEGFVIDSPVYPAELEALPDVVRQAGFAVSGLLATHGDWDHLLGRLAFPDAALGCAQTTARRFDEQPGHAQRELERFDEEHYVEARRLLSLTEIQELPVPGRLSLGSEHELELHPTAGHTADGMAIVISWARVLVCGDYLSPVEIPMLGAEGGSLGAYEQTLARLGELVAGAEWVVPGHGAPMRREQAQRIIDEDLEYARELRSGAQFGLPADRRSWRQAEIHARNMERRAQG